MFVLSTEVYLAAYMAALRNGNSAVGCDQCARAAVAHFQAFQDDVQADRAKWRGTPQEIG